MGIEVTKRSVAEWIAVTQNRGLSIPLTLHTTSGSMLPAIRMNVDTVVIVPCGAEDVRPGDIVLIRKPASPAGVLLHRLVRIRDCKLVTRGDNMPRSDGETDANSLLGRAVSITGPGKSVDCDSCLRRLQGKVIVHTYPLRRVLSLTRRACRKLVRLMLPHRVVDKIEREWKKTKAHE